MILQRRPSALLEHREATHGITAEEVPIPKHQQPERSAIEFHHRRSTCRDSQPSTRRFVPDNVTVYWTERDHRSCALPRNYRKWLLQSVAAQNAEYTDAVIIKCIHLDVVTKITRLTVAQKRPVKRLAVVLQAAHRSWFFGQKLIVAAPVTLLLHLRLGPRQHVR